MALDHNKNSLDETFAEIEKHRTFEYDTGECPALVPVYLSSTSGLSEMAEDEWADLEELLQAPSCDPRSDWELAAACLTAHELFSEHGLHLDLNCQNWQPTEKQSTILIDFVEQKFSDWPTGDGTLAFAYRDARCILFQQKLAVYECQLAAKEKSKQPRAKVKKPTAFAQIDKALAGVKTHVDSLELDALIRRLCRSINFKTDLQALNYLVDRFVESNHIRLGKRDARKVVNRIVAEQATANRPKRGADTTPVVNEWSDHEMAEFAQDRLRDAVDGNGDPVIYVFKGDVCDLQEGSRRMLSEAQFGTILDSNTHWLRRKGEDDKRIEFAPKQIVRHNYNRLDKEYAVLAEVKSSPFFASDGRRVDTAGYDKLSETFLDCELDVPAVSAEPSPEEVNEAKRLLIEEMMGDFPFEGIVDRHERMNRGLRNEPGSQPMPSIAHAVCMCIERSVRDLIAGPTPVYAPTKPAPGTGAGRLVGAITLAATGRKAAAEPMPTSDEEYAKVMGAHINHSSEFTFFDNMNAAISLGSFASNVSEGRVRTRLLGSSRMVEADVRHTWVAAANNIKGTSEILRRMVMIELDAKTPNPENRTGFRHPDLEAWTQENRPKLVWAILTLVQNWVAKGMKPWTGRPKASFEAWSRVMGGILRDAEIRGFLENEARLRSYGATGGDNGVEMFIQHLASTHCDGTLFRAGGTAEVRGRKEVAVFSIKDELNVADDGKPLLLDGWGYNREDGSYNHARGIVTAFRETALRAYEVASFEGNQEVRYAISFMEAPDPQSQNQYFWEMSKHRMD
ncbi:MULTISPECIES: hypothetical protein [unclassified Phaeobacter]|uniref:hypothetical protein n=2 Tax=unclassified Phaeobacter TaxID=2621772 RepID=UPI003A89AC3F